VTTEDHGYLLDEAEVVFWEICPTCQVSTNDDTKSPIRYRRPGSDQHTPQADDNGCRYPGRERRALAHRRPERPAPAQDHYLIEQMAQFNRERIRSASRTPRVVAPSAASR
jgi:hypothetical protein